MIGNCNDGEQYVRVIVLDISKTLGSEVYDEAIVNIQKASEIAKKYTDMSKYRIVTI